MADINNILTVLAWAFEKNNQKLVSYLYNNYKCVRDTISFLSSGENCMNYASKHLFYVVINDVEYDIYSLNVGHTTESPVLYKYLMQLVGSGFINAHPREAWRYVLLGNYCNHEIPRIGLSFMNRDTVLQLSKYDAEQSIIDERIRELESRVKKAYK